MLASFLVCLASRCLCACDTMHTKKCIWTLENGNALVYVIREGNHFFLWNHNMGICVPVLWFGSFGFNTIAFIDSCQTESESILRGSFIYLFIFKTERPLKRNSYWNNPLSAPLCVMPPWLHFVWIISLHTLKSVNKRTCGELSFADKTGPPPESAGILLIRLNKLSVFEFSAEGLLKAETEGSQLCRHHCLRVTRQQRTFYLTLDEFCLHETEGERKRDPSMLAVRSLEPSMEQSS